MQVMKYLSQNKEDILKAKFMISFPSLHHFLNLKKINPNLKDESLKVDLEIQDENKIKPVKGVL